MINLYENGRSIIRSLEAVPRVPKEFSTCTIVQVYAYMRAYARARVASFQTSFTRT